MKIAHVVQGKNSPHYMPNKVDHSDRCIILNAKYAYLTGQKLDKKLYRHHTGYPGGLKEIKAKHFLEKDAEGMMLRAVRGMLPKNLMRKEFLKKVTVYDEGAHDLQNKGLPQFGAPTSIDYNEIFGLGSKINPQNTKIIYSNVDDKDLPDELKSVPKEIDPDFNKPEYTKDKKSTFNQRLMSKYKIYETKHRTKFYKRIRNMGYRYI
jgi:large subunit ribosomal protein L13